ncbi:DUAL SPECIFICITY PROTEIN PHOSPHATASE 1E, indole-3-butyric acid response 5 [Hibiscus trionum]|uniref:DUAL SPECIFICITY PROTEIN PHOSPHATASE 1E, indole-3-butyric acid response 5 n=1 Tax=Hibiscus trionum TaxID=183268 RepID=A0A9W7H121_HIBTR|nr:DUAL SPECIFICITY PROTEIN PHOSPHATASE 1E, indole-3-butyric acid response 5 [Hibiscus trionum]
MRKRERENPCGICGHYHKYEEGEICGICGHRIPLSSDKTSLHVSAFPSVILPDFLYLGSYDNASRSELLMTQGITRVLNTVPACQNLYKNSFTYHCLQDDRILQFDDAIQFLEQCERDKARVLVHCMSGKNRSPAIVIAFLMKSKGWRLPQSYQWVKERRTSVDINQAIYQQLQEYEQKLFGSSNNNNPALFAFQLAGAPFSAGFSKADDPVPVPVPVPMPILDFDNLGTPSIFSGPPLEAPLHKFTFGAGQTQKRISESH